MYIFLLLSGVIISQSVPENFQSLYNELSVKLESIDSALTDRWDGEKHCTNYCTSLLPAISNRGEVLLDTNVINAVKLYLDAYDSLGVSAVDIAIQYPILVNDFPNSDGYLEFYKKTVSEIRARNFKLIIGCQSTFRDTVFGDLPVDDFYDGLTTERYKAEKKQMIETIINELEPDYLTIETEPATQAMNLDLDFSPESVIEYIEYFLNGLDKKGVLIGGGAGTWEEIEYIDMIAQQPGIDYIDFHIYPIIKDFIVDKVFTIDSIATAYNKKLVLGESWLHKANAADLADLDPPEIFVRDIYSFWIPLDSIFTESVVKLSHYANIELTNLIWATHLFAYIDYLPVYETTSINTLYDLAYAASTPKILSKTLSPTGSLYKSLISEACDTSSTGINSMHNSPYGFDLAQNYPNPFNSQTIIEYYLPENANVRLAIYDVLGREIVKLVNGYRQSGNNVISWNGLDNYGEQIASGMYFYTLSVYNNNGSRKSLSTKKIILIK